MNEVRSGSKERTYPSVDNCQEGNSFRQVNSEYSSSALIGL